MYTRGNIFRVAKIGKEHTYTLYMYMYRHVHNIYKCVCSYMYVCAHTRRRHIQTLCLYTEANLGVSVVFQATCPLVFFDSLLLQLHVGRYLPEGSTALRVLLLQLQTLCHQPSYVDTAVCGLCVCVCVCVCACVCVCVCV